MTKRMDTQTYLQIIQLINSFGSYIDQRNWEKFQTLFARQTEFDYSEAYGPEGTFSPEEIVEMAKEQLGTFTATHHQITNHLIDFKDDSTVVIYAHVRPLHFLENPKGEQILETGGMYTGRIERMDGEWKIVKWSLKVQWSRGNQALFEMARESKGK